MQRSTKVVRDHRHHLVTQGHRLLCLLEGGLQRFVGTMPDRDVAHRAEQANRLAVRPEYTLTGTLEHQHRPVGVPDAEFASKDAGSTRLASLRRDFFTVVRMHDAQPQLVARRTRHAGDPEEAPGLVGPRLLIGREVPVPGADVGRTLRACQA